MRTIAHLRRVVLVAAAIAACVPGSASAQAPLPGPPLRATPAALAASWGCQGGFGPSAPVTFLLVHGAIGTAGQWESNYARVLRRGGHPVCTVSVPDRALGDAQASVEYVVAAIRGAARLAGRPIVVVGHSMGSELSTYALRFWPDLADDVQDFVGLAGVYEQGTAAAPALCRVACPLAADQITPGSAFLEALAAHPLYPGPGYTTIGTTLDELVVPQPKAGLLTGVRNIELQDVCPGRLADHVSIIDDALVYALVLDAAGHPGGADPARLSAGICAETTIAGSDPPGLGEEVGRFTVGLGPFLHGGPEPKLRCYLDPACPRPRLVPGLTGRTARVARTRAYRATGTLVLPAGAIDRCAGTVAARLVRGRRTLARGAAAVAADCAYAVALRLPRGAGTRGLRAVVAYRGDAELLPRPGVRRAPGVPFG